jgi:hypothetical protein
MSQPVKVSEDFRQLSECLASVDSDEGRLRVSAYLHSRPFPHYEPAPNSLDLLVRIEADGSRILGRFVGREFQAQSDGLCPI